jgi:hypothetical protein
MSAIVRTGAAERDSVWTMWCRLQDSNPWPPDYKSGALPTELSRHAERPLASNYAKGPALSLSYVRI